MPRPIVLNILSTSRSGSTLIDRALGGQLGGTSLGEVHQIWSRGFQQNHQCGCGESFHDCPFWRDVSRVLRSSQSSWSPRRAALLQAEVVRNRTIPFVRASGLATQAWKSARDAYGSLLTDLFSAVTTVAGTRVLIDSSKRPAHGALLVQTPGVEVRILHLVRDSRAVAFSLARQRPKSDTGKPGDMMQTMSSRAAAFSWNRSNLLSEFVARAADASVRVRYEDFIQAPEESLGRIAEALQLPEFTNQIMGTTLHLSPAHTVSGNPMRLATGDVKLKLDDEWRRKMNSPDRNMVTRVTAPLLWRYGYSVR